MANKLDIEKTRNALQNFEFEELFREELGWSSPKSSKSKSDKVKEITFTRKAIAELAGAVVFEITLEDGALPDPAQRKEISKHIRELHFENVCIFVDKDRSQSIWHWEKKHDKKMMPRDHFYMRGQPGDLFIAKLSSLVVDLSDFDKEGNIPIAEVASRMKAALDVEVVTKKFYKSYQEEFNGFLEFIEGITDENDRKWYASVVLNRLMFIYFLQRKFFLDGGDADYLSTKLVYSKKNLGKNKYYEIFLKKLFFEGFAKEESHRSSETNKLIGKIKYLNGGLFLLHKIEKKYNGKIRIADKAFENLLELFKAYSWNLNDTPGGQDNELNPDVLGYIFEKYINQKAFGAYYTRTEITEYLCEQTVYKLILDAINGPDTSEHDEVIEKVKSSSSLLSKPTPLTAKNKEVQKRKRYERIEDLLINLDAEICRKLVVGEHAVLPNLSLLDPACGSGAFLVAAMKTLINVYSAILGKIKFLGDKKLASWLDEIEANHPSVNYYIKKQIITNNLYGVDIMEEASEIAKLRLFLALVASAQKVEDLEPLPNIDFNIMTGNSLIGLMRVDEKIYNKHQEGDMFKKSYNQLIQEREAAIRGFKSFEGDREVLQSKKEAIERFEAEANDTLDVILGQEFDNLGIKYEQIVWDVKTGKTGKPIKRKITIGDIEAMTPFHWGYEFSEIFRKKNGFDAIITNPPWEIVQATEKEFFNEFADTDTRKMMNVFEFVDKRDELLKNKEIKKRWEIYCSSFPHLNSYFKKSKQYKHQISYLDGAIIPSKNNLYKLFTERCFSLLNTNGYCGIIVPNSIYMDAGSKSLRELLFNSTKINSLFGLANERFIFEGVDHRFRFCILTYQKGNSSTSIRVAFRIDPREAIKASDLEIFFRNPDEHLNIPIALIKRISPDSLSIDEFKSDLGLRINEKLFNHPFLKEKIPNTWNLEFTTEFDKKASRDLFETKKNENNAPLYSGSCFHQFNHQFTQPTYFINIKKGKLKLGGKNGGVIHGEVYRLLLRRVTSPTNERSLISTIVPPIHFCDNSVNYVIPGGYSLENLVYVCAVFNSFVFDFMIRSKLNNNITIGLLKQMPVPRIDNTDRRYSFIIKRAIQLVCTTEDMEELGKDVLNNNWNKHLVVTNENDRKKIRYELDAVIAHLYGLSEDEFNYILSNFPAVPLDIRIGTIETFKKLTSEYGNNQYSDSGDLRDLIAKGEQKKLEFKSTLSFDLKEQSRKNHIEHSVLKTIAAFLNSEGGTLLIGVTDDGQVHGLEDDFKVLGSKGDPRDNFNKHFDNLISNNFGRDIHRLISLSLEEIDEKLIAKVEVKEKAPEEVFLSNKDKNSIEEFYVRLNASSVALTGKEQSKYIRQHWK